MFIYINILSNFPEIHKQLIIWAFKNALRMEKKI
jgi:hypothetical protein